MKLTKSKQFLADAIHASGKGWRHGAISAAQCKSDLSISFYRDKPYKDGVNWWGEHIDGADIPCEKLAPNWHQTVLSREEYFSVYPAETAADADGWIEWNGGGCPVDGGEFVVCKVRSGREWRDGKPIMAKVLRWSHTGGIADIIAYRLHKPEHVETEYKDGVKPTDTAKVERPSKPTIEQLAADYRNKLDCANRKQQEADEAKAVADAALGELVAGGQAIGLAVSPITAKQAPKIVKEGW
jgi:hypothetical protein